MDDSSNPMASFSMLLNNMVSGMGQSETESNEKNGGNGSDDEQKTQRFFELRFHVFLLNTAVILTHLSTGSVPVRPICYFN